MRCSRKVPARILWTSSSSRTWTSMARMRRIATCSSSTTAALGICGTPSAVKICVEAPLARLASELQGEHMRALDPGLAVEERRVLVAEALHDHSLAHAAVAVDGDA